MLESRHFALHPQLAADTVQIADLRLSSVRLMNNAAVPWLVLVPRIENKSELIDLSDAEQNTVWNEIRTASEILRRVYNPKKLNVASLGNIVPQLHFHVIARFESDAAWPKPVWGNVPSAPYSPDALDAAIANLKNEFGALA